MIGILAVDGTEASGYTSPLESSFPGGYRDQTKSCCWVIGGISFSALAKYTTIFSPLCLTLQVFRKTYLNLLTLLPGKFSGEIALAGCNRTPYDTKQCAPLVDSNDDGDDDHNNSNTAKRKPVQTSVPDNQ